MGLLPASVSADDDTVIVDLTVNVAGEPVVYTLYPIGVGATKATLCGWLADLGTAPSVQVSFGWDTTSHAGDPSGYANWTTPQIKTEPGFFKQRIYGLKKNSVYYFRAVAVGDTTTYGAEYELITHPGWHYWFWRWWGRFCPKK